MLDYAITGASVLDGTGAPAVVGDVGVRDGRIVAVGHLDERAAEVFDAAGLVVAPGFVDPHTHYDAQLHWDPAASPSSSHGVTSVVGGNCGFTLAPLRNQDADYVRRMMSRVEGMAIPALELGASWSWESFGEFLDELEGRTAVNAGFLVGHCALRRYVMGADATEREATDDERVELARLLDRSLDEGGLGLSTTRSSTHSDGDGNPVASRAASVEELLELCEVTGRHEGTTLEAIVEGCLRGFAEEENDLLAQMSSRANRALNWNVLSVAAAHPRRIERQLGPSRRARETGGRVVALTMPVHVEMNMSLGTFCALWLIPGWKEVLDQDPEARAAKLRDPGVRAAMASMALKTPFQRLAEFGSYEIGDTVAPQNSAFEGRVVADLAVERNMDPFECVCDIAIADDFKTVLWPLPSDDTEADWEARRSLWDHEDVVLGGSDAGAHLDRMLGASYPTAFIADSLRGRRLVSLERAVQLLTDVPARLFGLRGRGRVQPGWNADLVVFDPETIGSDRARRVYDLPGGAMRLTADSRGIEQVLVNGVVTVAGGEYTGATSGTVLRSGRDTETVTAR